MLATEEPDASGLLRAWSEGDEVALNALTPIVYNELRRLARRYLRLTLANPVSMVCHSPAVGRV